MIATVPGAEAVHTKGWLAAHRWLIARRAMQIGLLALFASGPLAGVWIAKGTLASSLTLDVLPLTDPLILLQSLLAGHVPAATALVGAGIVVGVYLLVGGRSYCAWACPVNLVTDAAHWLHARAGLDKGWQPSRSARTWLLAAVLGASAATGTVAWEAVNPVTILHRGLVFGTLLGGAGLALVLAVFVFDLAVSRRGWCGRLCPVGAFYGLLGTRSVVRVSAPERSACNDCMDCIAVCPEPQVIPPALHPREAGASALIDSGDCTNCGRCIDVCSKNVFRFTTRFSNGAHPAGHGVHGARDEAA